MSPVHTTATGVSSFRTRRRPARPTTASLFCTNAEQMTPPVSPSDISPKQEASEPAPVTTGPDGSSSGRPTADFPPPSRVNRGSQNFADNWTGTATLLPRVLAHPFWGGRPTTSLAGVFLSAATYQLCHLR